jgi:Protein of unknown function with HXXEE motif
METASIFTATDARTRATFLALVVVQALHSIEEYHGRLYEVFLPARAVSGLISTNLQHGFVVFNVTLVAFGLWCFFWPVRKRWAVASGLMWLWVGIELLNGIGHPIWSLARGAYTPGVATAPVLLGVALYLARQLCERARSAPLSG